MSVPLPSPALLPTTAKAIPRTRPTPIMTSTPTHEPSSPSSPSRRSATRSGGFNAPSSTDENWRSRMNGENGSKSATSTRGPERTVGGFGQARNGVKDKESNGTATAAATATAQAAKDKEDTKAALSHVPCRFFKAGTCTAGASCPFSHEEGGKREICQWFLKGNCKFGHKCALAHVRPGEPLSMDRKNKKDAQRELRERDGKPRAANDEQMASPVPIKSALSSSIQSPPPHRIASSPMREPYGPPSGVIGAATPGFGLARSPANFASSPSRPSPLSASFGTRTSLSLKAGASPSMHSPLRPPTTAAPGVFSSSFSHSSVVVVERGGPPLSASFADGTMRRNIWARSEAPEEPLSPARRPVQTIHRRRVEDVFQEDEDDHGEDLLPSSLSDLLTPTERARRMSRRDSQDSFSASPSQNAFLHPGAVWPGGERLAQSAGAHMGPGYLQSLWDADGADARKGPGADQKYNGNHLAFGQTTAAPPPRQSLLTQQRSPISPQRQTSSSNILTTAEASYTFRPLGDPSSPSARALQEHAPGQSLPGGLASALSRLHLHGPKHSSGLVHETESRDVTPPHLPTRGKDEHEDEGVFAMEEYAMDV
ncbi:hypothetical protein BCR39DRAFT_561687 [Naematelia encephala]|uniref:C3H1-type domain-containing protein n=1 Tax=Naematelia encephala TaxID=71784 RepID=A0A1Y2AN99_9TREE|nr:hypothetical protein BCR39DRAFT_561687 [Naematelia encephala]